jgi:hypothetical protein
VLQHENPNNREAGQKVEESVHHDQPALQQDPASSTSVVSRAAMNDGLAAAATAVQLVGTAPQVRENAAAATSSTSLPSGSARMYAPSRDEDCGRTDVMTSTATTTMTSKKRVASSASISDDSTQPAVSKRPKSDVRY